MARYSTNCTKLNWNLVSYYVSNINKSYIHLKYSLITWRSQFNNIHSYLSAIIWHDSEIWWPFLELFIRTWNEISAKRWGNRKNASQPLSVIGKWNCIVNLTVFVSNRHLRYVSFSQNNCECRSLGIGSTFFLV